MVGALDAGAGYMLDVAQNPRKLVLVRDWKDTLTTVKSSRRLRGGAKKGKMAHESEVLFDDCQVNEVGFGHIVVWCFRLFEGSQFNCSAIATITADDGCQYASAVVN